MKLEGDLVFACPCCGQGGLGVAQVGVAPRVEAVVCQECDRVWLSPKRVGITNEDGPVEEVLPKLGATPDWSSINYGSEGVSWSRIAPDYQAILLKAGRDGSRQNA